MDGCTPWPTQFATRYRERGYWAGETLGDAFVRATVRFADRAAIVDRERVVTYTQLGELVERLAGHLVAREICAGQRVLFQLPNVLEFVVAYFACLRVGAIPVCCHPHHRHAEVEAIARLTEAKAWFIAADFRNFDYCALADEIGQSVPSIREVWVVGEQRSGTTASFETLLSARAAGVRSEHIAERQPCASDVAVFQLSGGTTGIPKVIPRTHDDYFYASRIALTAKSVDATSVCLLPVPLAHNMSLAAPGLQGSLLTGARVVLAISPSADHVLPMIERERVTWMPSVPATLMKWVEAASTMKVDVSSLRSIYVGGQRLQPAIAAAAVAAFGPVVRQNYGMAEGLGCATSDGDPPEVHLTCQGKPISPGDDLRIVGDDGSSVPLGEIGQLLCRGPTIVRGYYRGTPQQNAAFTPDGFYRTGDMVRMTDDGFIVVEGRSTDLINRGGEKIASEELESLLLRHPAIRRVAVVATPDPILGERACACVVLGEGESLTLAEAVAFLSEQRIASYKFPERLEIFDQLPETGVGKVSKAQLRVMIADRPT
jgi:2,3-dihydroxybenzoate-AMP ligase